MSGRRGIPSAAELVAAVREFLRADVMESTTGAVRFNARVAANVLAIVERELALAEPSAAAHHARLAALGVGDDAELAAAIRAGRFDDRLPEVVAALRDSTRERLAIDNPRHLTADDAARRS